MNRPIFPTAPDDFAAPAPEGVMALMKHYASMANLLRLSGALTVVAAMSAFLLQDWSGGDDVERFYLLLAHTVLLAAGGFGLSFLVKENKGARLFFGLSLLSVTANMATLSALIFSLTQWSGSLGDYPAVALWRAASPEALMVAAGVGLLAVAPVTVFGFSVLARRSALLLAALFAGTNLLMLLPIRGTELVGLVAMAAILLPLGFLPKLRRDATLQTLEGRFAVAALFAPALLIVARHAALYHMDAFTLTVLAGTAYTSLRFGLPSFRERQIGAFAGMVAFAVAALVVLPLVDLLNAPHWLSYAMAGLGFLGFGLDITHATQTHRRGFATVTALLLGGCMGAAFGMYSGIVGALLLIATGAGIAAMGLRYGSRLLLIGGAAMAGLGVLHQLREIVFLVDFSHWITLAMLGAGAIIAASLLERHGAILKLRCERIGARLREV